MAEAVKAKPNQQLRYERERRCWSQQELADKVGTTPLNISRWERGITLPGPHFRQKLCELFELSAQQLGLVPENTASDTLAKPSQLPATPVTLPLAEASVSLWNVPYRRNIFFTGREDILIYLRDALISEQQPVALAQPQAISGLGGIGKTQTAVEYAHRYHDSYHAVFWARADSHDLLVSDFLTIAALLNLSERNEQDQSKVVSAVMRWFDSHEQWLLVLDNADNLEMVSEFVPSAGKGHVLLTTRAHFTGTIAQRIELEKMGLEEGSLFLLRRAKRLKDASLETVVPAMRSQAQAIVEAVDGLPLALDQAGAYIEETGCSLIDYLRFYKTRWNRLLRTRGGDVTGHPEPVATTWSLSFEKVERANPAAAELLRLCAFLHPDAIPESMLTEGASELGPILQSIVEDPLDLNEAIGELLTYSLVRRDPEKKMLNIHRLVQAVLKDALDREIQQRWAERTIRMLNRAFPDPKEFTNWPICQQYLPHVQVCTDLIEQWNITSTESAHLLHQCGAYLRDRGQYNEAKSLLQKALAQRQETQGKNHLDTAHTLNKLGEVLYEQSLLDLAEPLYQEALTIYHTILGNEHVDIATLIDNMALLYHTQGKYDQAGVLYKQALDMRQTLLGSDHADVAVSLSNWASLYYDQAHYDKAGQLIQRALRIHEHLLGPNHPSIAEDLNNLAMIYIEQEKYEQAEIYLHRTIAIWEEVMGPDYLHIGTTLGNLGYLYYLQEKYDLAISLYQRSLTILKKTLGSEHYSIAGKLNNLGKIYSKLGDYTRAETFFLEAVGIYKRTLGQDHPYATTSYTGLAQIYSDQGAYDQAEALLQHIISIQEQTLGSEHPEIVAPLQNYVTLLRHMSRDDEAVSLEARLQALQAKHE